MPERHPGLPGRLARLAHKDSSETDLGSHGAEDHRK